MRDYEAWAEFGDVLRLPIDPERDVAASIPWEQAGFQAHLPLIDVGPGSGVTTVVLAETFPDAEIVAVEPDLLMRSLLMTRLAERSGVRERTTVLPGVIQETWLPAECGGALLFNVIYFLGERERERFWHRMADVLVPGASVLMSRSYGGAGEVDVERKLVSSGTVGRHEYQRWYASHALGDGRVEIINQFQVLRDGEVVRDEETRITPYGLGEDRIVDEIPVGAFGIEEIDERYLAIRRHPDLARRKRR
ncbi:class I SAM-dependent methyltransferase [Demetria terragena]|uniref:class I SAM-dependent methyltransferase n=1 Tax=Demetria terragena TaxID=63959 RepID=UPI0003628C28|nr:class I SAM-dependent methyltransferase [Demetria terragena]